DASGRDASRPDAATPSACSLPAPMDQGVTYERTLHVATSGTAGGDGSAAAPFDSIRSAAAVATPGTRILVAAGSYGSFYLENLQGEPGRPIAIVADGDVTLDAAGSGTVVRMSDPAYLVFEGFTLANAGEHGMNIDDGGSYDSPAHHLVLRNITVPGAGSGGNNDCLKMSGVDDFWVLGADISACNRGEAIDMVGCHRGVIAGNHFHDVVGNGVQAKGGSADTLIHGNLFSDIPGRAVNAGGSTGLPYFRPMDAPYEAANIRVIANVFERVGADSGAPVAYVGCDACSFANNTIIEPLTWVARILQESTDARFVPSREGLFVNNLVVLDTSVIRTFVNVGGNTAPETFVFANNLWFATDRGAGWGGPTYSDGLPPEMDSVLQMDPLLVDRAGGDYHPMAGSPAAGVGRALPFPQPPDFDGRCYADPPSAGAFELP
ncbi:MAG: hypothetical protein GXP55_02665, partial [Deltaproteobacteria bacterium]|nr:hypothetical protein [Deltaproteobacteria bacterium]